MHHKPKFKNEFLEESKGVNLCDLGPGNDFLDMTPKAQATEEKK